MSESVQFISIVKKYTFKVECLKKYQIFKKSEKKRAIPSFYEIFQIGMESLGEKFRMMIGPKVCREWQRRNKE